MQAKQRSLMRKYNLSWRKVVFIVCMLIIPILNFAVFTVYANLGGVFLSFRQFNGLEEVFVGWDNYARFFRRFVSDNYLETTLVSLSWLPVVLFVMFPLTLMICFFLYKKVPNSKIIIVLLFLPNIVPAAVMAEFYRRMWDTGGVTDGLLARMFAFVEGRSVNWLSTETYANWALWIYTVWFGFGLYSLVIWGAMTRVPEELIESARMDGGTLRTEFFRIVIPVIWPTLVMVMITYIIVPFTISTQPLILAANGSNGTRTLALLAIQELKKPDVYYSATINILLACVSMPIALISRKLLMKVYSVVEM